MGKEKPEKLVMVTVRLPEGLVRRVKVYAATREQSSQQVVKDALESYLDGWFFQERKKKGAK